MKVFKKELELKSSEKNIPKVEKFIEDICDEFHISNIYFGNIIMAVEEGVKNAIRHGNKNDERQTIKIHFRTEKNSLIFMIQDQGKGFDHNAIPNPLENEDSTGKGIFIMRSLADTIRYNLQGNSVELIFKFSTINQATTLQRIFLLLKYFKKQKSFA